MNKDFVNRIFNVSEMLGYLFVIYLRNCGNCEYTGDSDIYFSSETFLLSLLFVLFLRMCSNYIFQIKSNNSVIVFAVKKIYAKIKLVVSSI